MKLIGVLLAGLLVPTAIHASAAAFPLQNLVADKDYESGAGCDYTSSDGRTIFVNDTADNLIKVKGRLQKLKCDRSAGFGSTKVGETFTETCVNDTTTLRFNWRITFTCPPEGDGNCEVERYAGDGELIYDGQKFLMKGLKGECGS